MNYDYIGLLSLGIFVGTIATSGLSYIEDLEGWKKVLQSIVPAALAGGSILFVNTSQTPEAHGCYPLGLAVGLLWAYVPIAVKKIGDRAKISKLEFWLLGLGHLAACIVLTGTAVIVVLLSTFGALHFVKR